MTHLRPEAVALLHSWAEPAVAAALALFGLWLVWLGGWVLIPIGLVLAALGGAWALLGVRRARFSPVTGAPGLVELDERRLRYLHPLRPGDISIDDLAEVKILTLRGRQLWRLKDLSGQVLLVPLDAAGAAELFDALAALPGMSSAGLVAALQPAPQPGKTTLPVVQEAVETLVWHRRGTGLNRV